MNNLDKFVHVNIVFGLFHVKIGYRHDLFASCKWLIFMKDKCLYEMVKLTLKENRIFVLHCISGV